MMPEQTIRDQAPDMDELRRRADEAQARAKTQQNDIPNPLVNLPEFVERMNTRAKDRMEKEAARWRPLFDELPPSLCEKHGTTMSPDWDNTFEHSAAHQEFRPMYVPCLECGSEEERARKRRLWARRGIPERLLEASCGAFESLTVEHAQARILALGMAAGGGPLFLFLLGDNGQGKSHLGAATLRRRGEGLFITHKCLIDEIRSSYGSKTMTPQDIIENYQETPLLVLDEAGLTTGGADEQVHLCDILCKRHDKRLPTIITSNKSLPELKEILGFRVMDRIAEDYQCRVLRGESYRRKN